MLQGGVLKCNLCEVWVLYNDGYGARTGRTRERNGKMKLDGRDHSEVDLRLVRRLVVVVGARDSLELLDESGSQREV